MTYTLTMSVKILLAISTLCLFGGDADSLRKRADVTALDEYVAKPDSSYKWSLIESYPDEGQGYSSHVLNMTSQTWMTEEVTSQPEWFHYVVIAIPSKIDYIDSAFLMVDNGDNDDPVPTPEGDQRINTTGNYALGTKAISVILKMIPNQAIHCQGDPPDRYRREDDLIAWTWRRYLNDPSDPEILLQLPMAKATVRAMDAVTEYVQGIYPTIYLSSYMLTGGSKRGWTTYLAAAVDPRVFAIIPEVLSCLNFLDVLNHQYRAYGGWSFAQEDYYDENITQEVQNPVMQQMMNIIDPYMYFDRYTMPKLIISATGDEHFMPDDSWYHWNDFIGQKYIWLLEDSGHNIGDSKHDEYISENMITFFRAVKNGEPLPQMTWTRSQNSTHGSITLNTDIIPSKISAVFGDTIQGERRDFRMHIGIPDPENPVPQDITWTEEPISMVLPGVYKLEYNYAVSAWRCFFIKMTYVTGEGRKFYVTSEVNIIPDSFPYPNCQGEVECYGSLL